MSLPGAVLSLDVGTAKIGIAATDVGRKIVFSVATMVRKSVAKDAEAIARLCAAREVTQLVVGLPDTNERMQRLARQVGDAVAAVVKVPVDYVDEGYTSAEARTLIADRGARRDEVDAVAAAIILEAWLATRAG